MTTIQQAAEAAKLCEAATELPALLTMAQWALESGWGKSEPGNNCFGIKSYQGCFATQSLSTHETANNEGEKVMQEFACFECLADCFKKHAELITTAPAYAKAWSDYQKSKDPFALAHDIAHTYARDQLYGVKIQNLMRSQAIILALR